MNDARCLECGATSYNGLLKHTEACLLKSIDRLKELSPMSDKTEDTVEVSITWLERLIELSKALDEDFPKTDRLKHLKGYIESAEFLIPKVSAIEQERGNLK